MGGRQQRRGKEEAVWGSSIYGGGGGALESQRGRERKRIGAGGAETGNEGRGEMASSDSVSGIV